MRDAMVEGLRIMTDTPKRSNASAGMLALTGVAVMGLVTLPVAASIQESPPTRAVNRALMDTTCAPCQDFYRFANGRWLDTVTIPSGRSSWGEYPRLQARNADFIAALLDSLARFPDRVARSPSERNIGAFYGAC